MPVNQFANPVHESVLTAVEDAIKNTLIITFDYKDCFRVVEPHCCGLFATGNVSLRGFQIEGESNDMKVPDWGTFNLNKIKNIEITNKVFLQNRPKYNPDDKVFVKVYWHV